VRQELASARNHAPNDASAPNQQNRTRCEALRDVAAIRDNEHEATGVPADTNEAEIVDDRSGHAQDDDDSDLHPDRNTCAHERPGSQQQQGRMVAGLRAAGSHTKSAGLTCRETKPRRADAQPRRFRPRDHPWAAARSKDETGTRHEHDRGRASGVGHVQHLRVLRRDRNARRRGRECDRRRRDHRAITVNVSVDV